MNTNVTWEVVPVRPPEPSVEEVSAFLQPYVPARQYNANAGHTAFRTFFMERKGLVVNGLRWPEKIKLTN